MPMEPNGPVVVGVDGSSASLGAVDLAVEEAAARVVPLVVVMADTGRPGAAGSLEDAVGEARAQHPGLSVMGTMVAGDPAAVLLDQARDASLLVIGDHGHGGARCGAVGSVALHVIGTATVPVLVHRPMAMPAEVTLPRPVLVGVEDDEPDAVLAFAFEAAALRGAPLQVVRVDPPTHEEHTGGGHLFEDALQRWGEKYPQTGVLRTVRSGVDGAVALTAASRSAQLAVIGTGCVGSPAVCSVCHALLHRGGCPIAVVPRPVP